MSGATLVRLGQPGSAWHGSICRALGIAPAHAARGEEEPVHEDALAVVVRVVGQQPVPLVLLLAAAVSRAPLRLGFPE